MSGGHRSTVSFGGDTPIGALEGETEDESEVMGGEGHRVTNGGIHDGPLATMADFFFGGGELNSRVMNVEDDLLSSYGLN